MADPIAKLGPQTIDWSNPAVKPLNNGLVGKNQLGEDSFIQLLTTELRNQDPLDPMDHKETISQLAQFNSLNETIKLNKSFSYLTMQNFANLSSLIDKQVTYVEVAPTTGEVTNNTGKIVSISLNTGKLVLEGGKEISLEQINLIKNTPQQAPVQEGSAPDETTTPSEPSEPSETEEGTEVDESSETDSNTDSETNSN